jgi:hypothetical protein
MLRKQYADSDDEKPDTEPVDMDIDEEWNGVRPRKIIVTPFPESVEVITIKNECDVPVKIDAIPRADPVNRIAQYAPDINNEALQAVEKYLHKKMEEQRKEVEVVEKEVEVMEAKPDPEPEPVEEFSIDVTTLPDPTEDEEIILFEAPEPVKEDENLEQEDVEEIVEVEPAKPEPEAEEDPLQITSVVEEGETFMVIDTSGPSLPTEAKTAESCLLM